MRMFRSLRAPCLQASGRRTGKCSTMTSTATRLRWQTSRRMSGCTPHLPPWCTSTAPPPTSMRRSTPWSPGSGRGDSGERRITASCWRSRGELTLIRCLAADTVWAMRLDHFKKKTLTNKSNKFVAWAWVIKLIFCLNCIGSYKIQTNLEIRLGGQSGS